MTRIFPRFLIKSAIMGALLCPATLFALGLGEIHLNSALSQPFDAEVELLNPTADELGSLKVGLASAESFTRMGLDRPAYLSGFVFKVLPTGDGRAVVRVTSAKAITEPLVSLLLEVSWARGRTLREYTVFLDPPVFVPVQPAAQSAGERTPTVPPVARTEGVIERPEQSAPAVPPTEAVPVPESTAHVPPPVTTAPAMPAAEPAPAVPMPVTPDSTAAPSPAPTLSGGQALRRQSTKP